MPSRPAESESPLLAELVERIGHDGPMPVDQFMQACLAHPRHGYYRTAQAIGASGDFVTAPEISQVFGELVGLWCAVAWEAMGRPTPLRLVELGPGRGTLMRDALRAARVLPGFLPAVTVHLVEISAPLRQQQRETLLTGDAPPVTWHEGLAEVPAGPAIVVANEYLDALPIRQLVHDGQAWHERVVAATGDGRLRFDLGGTIPFTSAQPPTPGAIAELRAGEDELIAALASRAPPLLALLIDYGPADAGFGDTLQAVRRHQYADPLAEPGAADLTAHVQFAPLAAKAQAAGLAADGPMTQAAFLGQLGIVERTARLMAANPARAGELEAATQRLISPAGMGQLFKVLVVRSPGFGAPAPFR